MKNKFILLLLLLATSCFSVIQAQIKQITIIEELEIPPASGEGIVKITVDSKIKELIGFLSPEISLDKDNIIKTNGFRIQVFMSNAQTARKELMDKGTLIKNAFSDIAVYDSYVTPNWKLLVGDFLTKEEADVFKQKLLKAIPALGKEMYVVQDKINISIRRN